MVERRNQFRVHAMRSMTSSPRISAQHPISIANMPASSVSTGRGECLSLKLSYVREFVFPQMLSPQINYECWVASSGITSSVGFHPFRDLFFVPSSAASLFLSLCICVFQEMFQHTASSCIHFLKCQVLTCSPELCLPSFFPTESVVLNS